MGKVMVNLTDPNSYPPGGRTWAIAFIGTAGDLPLLKADGGSLHPESSSISHTLRDGDNFFADEDTIAYWPYDSATVTVREAQRGESLAEAETRGGGRASGTVDIIFNVDGTGRWFDSATINVTSSASDVQAALRAMGGFLTEVEVSVESGMQRARNGGQ